MKLLGWMHRKFRQNSGEPFAIINGMVFLDTSSSRPLFNCLGHSCTCLSKQTSFDEQLQEQQQFYHPNANTYSKNLLQKSFVGMDSAIIEENVEYFTYDGHDSSPAAVAISGFFDGLLNIGTLGLGQHQLDSEPETPTFAVENVNGKETELTENDLKLINEELEKVLNADAKKEDDRFYCNDSPSARVTMTVVNGNDGGKQTPLHGCLWVSVDLPAETTIGSRKEHLNKEVSKWRSQSSTPIAASVSAENKLQKFIQRALQLTKISKSHKNESRNNTSKAPSYSSNYYQGNNAARVVTNEDIMLFPPLIMITTQTLPFEVNRSGSSGNREYWIKNRYLVLEL
ncbi:hypothetical protein MKW92_008730 [Papaver armeniacum]|nr:hypothetical protein MKW92_008730 [Papaver armeniacum]